MRIAGVRDIPLFNEDVAILRIIGEEVTPAEVPQAILSLMNEPELPASVVNHLLDLAQLKTQLCNQLHF